MTDASNSTTGQSSRTTNNGIILSLDGRNILAWKTLIPVNLMTIQHAWEATNGELTPDFPPPKPVPVTEPPTPKPEGPTDVQKAERKKNYEAGNKAARPILFASLNHQLVVSLFYGQSEEITAASIWSRVTNHFAKQSGVLKDLALTRFMSYRYKTNRSVMDNLNYFKKLMYLVEEAGTVIDRQMSVARLLSSLPSQFEALKQAFGSRPNTEKELPALYDIIEAEVSRRGDLKSDTDQTTALMSGMNISRPNRFHRGRPGMRRGFHRRGFQPHRPQHQPWHRPPHQAWKSNFSRTTEVICYNCNQKGHTANFCRRPKKAYNKHRPKQTESHQTEAFVMQTQKYDADSKDAFLIDSGCTHSVANDLKWFTSYTPFAKPRVIRLGGTQTIEAFGQGSLSLTIHNGDDYVPADLGTFIYAPKIRKNLVAVTQLTDNGFTVTAQQSQIEIAREDVRLIAGRSRNLFVLRVKNTREGALEGHLSDSNKAISLKHAHNTLAHVHKEKVKEILKYHGVTYKDDLNICTDCLQGKQTKAIYKSRPTEALAKETGVIHADLCEPSQRSLGGARWFLCLLDEHSRYRKLYYLSSKDEAPDCI